MFDGVCTLLPQTGRTHLKRVLL